MGTFTVLGMGGGKWGSQEIGGWSKGFIYTVKENRNPWGSLEVGGNREFAGRGVQYLLTHIQINVC